MKALLNFFSTSGFMPHGHCFLWRPDLLTLHIGSDLLIGLAYVAISTSLLALVWKSRDLPFPRMYLAFGLFIVTCGITHFFSIWVLWNPDYWVEGIVKALTAAASVGTAILMPPLIPKALALVKANQMALARGKKLEEAHDEMSQLLDRARQVDELKKRLFANISHDLRTPLTLVLAPLERLAKSALPEAQNAETRIALAHAQILQKQIDEIFLLARLESQNVPLNLVQTNLHDLMAQIKIGFDELANERKVSLFFESTGPISHAVDPEKMERVLGNLLSNAFKFVGAGGTITMRLQKTPGRVQIQVQDDGHGVAPEHADSIFNRFYTAPQYSPYVSSQQPQLEMGTGLGLSIVKELVELHDGTISYADAAPKGALFTISLPSGEAEFVPDMSLERQNELLQETEKFIHTLKQDFSNAAKKKEPRATTQLPHDLPVQLEKKPGEKVLVVEDNPDLNSYISGVLQEQYEVESCFNGEDGLKRALNGSFAVVVTDLAMPIRSGQDMAIEIRKVHPAEKLPILVLSAHADSNLKDTLLQGTVQDYLLKPFSIAELQSRVRNLVLMKKTFDILSHELELKSGDVISLATALAHRSRELEKANVQKDEFIMSLSHELKTPLTVLLGWISLLQKNGTETINLEKSLKIMEKNGKSLLKLIEGLLDISSIVLGKIRLECKPCDVARILEECVESAQITSRNKNLTLSFFRTSGGSQESTFVLADSARLSQIILNLISNSIKFTPEGGRVSVTLEHTPENVVVKVSDTGIGIGAEFLPYVFDKMRQEDQSRSRLFGGLGLGLSIAKSLTEMQGGTLTAHSDGPGTGATFTAVFPTLNSHN